MAGTTRSQGNSNLERPGPNCADIGSSRRMDTVCIIVVNELVFKRVLYSREGYIGASMVDIFKLKMMVSRSEILFHLF